MRLLITFLAPTGMNPEVVATAVERWLHTRHGLDARFAEDPEAPFIMVAEVEVSDWEAEEKRDAIAWYLEGRDEIDTCKVLLLGAPAVTPAAPAPGRRHRRSPLAERVAVPALA